MGNLIVLGVIIIHILTLYVKNHHLRLTSQIMMNRISLTKDIDS